VGQWQSPTGESRILFEGDFRTGDRLVVNQLPGAIDGLRVQPTISGDTPSGHRSAPEKESVENESDEGMPGDNGIETPNP